MTLHPSVSPTPGKRSPAPSRRLAFAVLREQSQADSFARERLHEGFGVEGLDPQDRALATELVYGTLRHQITLDHLIEIFCGRSLRHVQAGLLDALRLGAYQVIYLQGVPVPAAVHETVELVSRELGRRAAGFANAVLRNLARESERVRGECAGPLDRAIPCGKARWVRFSRPVLPDVTGDPVGHHALAHSHPRWLVERWVRRFGWDETIQILKADNEPPPVFLRWRKPEGRPPIYEPFEGHPDISVAQGFGDVRSLPGYVEGQFVVQGVPSARSVDMLGAEPGMDVLDTCAAPGVKAVHLADRVSPGGSVLSVDKSLPRMKKVKENLTRLGIINVRCVVGDATDLGAWLQRPFPRILLDVPCSNTGELSRRVEVRLRLRENDIAGLAGMQGRLLGAAAPLLSPGGILVYCTCSLEEEEGPGVVQAFLRSAEGGYALDREDWFLPHRCGGTGGYAARIVRLAHVGQETTTDS